MSRAKQLIAKVHKKGLFVPVDLAYGALLTNARKSAGFTQTQMSEQIGASLAAVAWLESGRSGLSARREHAYETVLMRRRVLRARGTLQKAFHSLEEILKDRGIVLVSTGTPRSQKGTAVGGWKVLAPALKTATKEAAAEAWARHRTGKDQDPFVGRWPGKDE